MSRLGSPPGSPQLGMGAVSSECPSWAMARRGCTHLSPWSSQQGLQEPQDTKGEGGKAGFLRQCSAGNKEWVVTVTGFGLSLEECQVTTQSSNLSLVHLRICTPSVVELGGLKHHMHGAHYLVFSGVEGEK